MNRRLQREFSFENGYERREDETGNVSVHISKRNMVFAIPATYPFKPPVCFYKGENYISFLMAKQNKLAAFIADNRLDVPCVCCHNLLCEWSPVNSLQDLVIYFSATHKRFIKIKKYANWLSKLDMDAFLIKLVASFLDF